MPVLFLHARYDYTCETVNSRLADPMRELCADLTEAVLDTGHWMAQERPAEVSAAVARWLATSVPAVWPGPPARSRQLSHQATSATKRRRRVPASPRARRPWN